MYLATKYILYNVGVSIFLLIGFLGMVTIILPLLHTWTLYGSNEHTLNFEAIANQSYSLALEILLYIGFLIAFAFKLPITPLHTWLPNTHGKHITVHV